MPSGYRIRAKELQTFREYRRATALSSTRLSFPTNLIRREIRGFARLKGDGCDDTLSTVAGCHSDDALRIKIERKVLIGQPDVALRTELQ